MPRTKASRKAHRLAEKRRQKKLERESNPPEAGNNGTDYIKEELVDEEFGDDLAPILDTYRYDNEQQLEEEREKDGTESYQTDPDPSEDRLMRMQQLLNANKNASKDQLLRVTMLEGMHLMTVFVRNKTMESETIRSALAYFNKKRLWAKNHDDKGPKKVRKTVYDFCESVELMIKSVLDSCATKAEAGKDAAIQRPTEEPAVFNPIKVEEEEPADSMELSEMPEIKAENYDNKDNVLINNPIKDTCSFGEDYPDAFEDHMSASRKRTISQSPESQPSWNESIPAENSDILRSQPQAVRRPNILKRPAQKRNLETAAVIIVPAPAPTLSRTFLNSFAHHSRSARADPTAHSSFPSTSTSVRSEPRFDDNAYTDTTQQTIKEEPGLDDATDYPSECLFSSPDDDALFKTEPGLDDIMETPLDDYQQPSTSTSWTRHPAPIYAQPDRSIPRPPAAKRPFLPFTTMRQQDRYNIASAKHPKLQAVAAQAQQIMEDLRREERDQIVQSRREIAEEMTRLKRQVAPANCTTQQQGTKKVVMVPLPQPRGATPPEHELHRDIRVANKGIESRKTGKKDAKIRCGKCGEVFVSENDLRLHAMSFHPIKQRMQPVASTLADQPGTSQSPNGSHEDYD